MWQGKRSVSEEYPDVVSSGSEAKIEGETHPRVVYV